MITWDGCKVDFVSDGSLHDIYILKTTIKDWQVILDYLRTNYKIAFKLDSEPFNMASDVRELFELGKKATALLNFDLDGIDIACHFFCTEQIEFDFMPQEINGQERLSSLLNFVKNVGDLLGKDVLITPENVQESPIIEYRHQEKDFKHYSADI